MSVRGRLDVPPDERWRWWLMWDGDAVDAAASLGMLPRDDKSFAFAVMSRMPGWLYHVEAHSRWYLWDSRCYQPDGSRETGRIVQAFSIELETAWRELSEAARRHREQLPDADRKAFDDAVTPCRRYAAGLLRSQGQASALAWMTTTFGKDAEFFDDSWPQRYLLNCADGTYDLRTMERYAHRSADRLTWCLAAPDWSMRCPLFLQTVYRMAGEQPDIATFLLQVLGYCLIGDNPERKVFFWHGETASGKSVVLRVVSKILGTLAEQGTDDLITLPFQGQGRSGRTENSIRGKRLVVVPESSEHRLIEESQLKKLTGEWELSVHELFGKKTVRLYRTFTIIQPTNDMPTTSRPDAALRDRICIVPTGKAIPENQRNKHLADQIIGAEGPAVLALLMKYAQQYLRNQGLTEPHAVRIETDGYFGSQDLVAAFLDDEAVMDPDGFVLRSDILRRFGNWSRNSGRNGGMSSHRLYEALRNQPGVSEKDQGRGRRGFTGIRWQETSVFDAG